MRTEDFNFQLPERLIAQQPLRQRDACRLLLLDRRSGAVRHTTFPAIVDLLKPDDLLVFNDTRVLAARLFCRKVSGGKVEVLFTNKIDPTVWKALIKPARGLKTGSQLFVDGDPEKCTLTIDSIAAGGEWTIRLTDNECYQSIADVIERHGVMPLPPYIKRAADSSDGENYQTVFARNPGAIAAPTAGLHFSADLLASLRNRGVGTAFLTLHVGIGTFLPVKVDDPREHVMHGEEYELGPEAIEALLRTKRRGGRVVAVGTTVVRVLEHCARTKGEIEPSRGSTNLKILPPYEFKIVDGLITNFHLPKSTLLMLVSAFASREHILAAYAEAIREQYRFFSYGDAMFIY